jgi:NAD(P)-dependent dehydrogenase (short-subunit alcohol dehydrogenase family)
MTAPAVRTLLDFSGKVVLVTGGSSGLGAGIALRFAEAGARLAVHYHANSSAAQALVARSRTAGGEAVAAHADLTREDQVQALMAQVMQEFGRLDVLINNAGIYPIASLLEMTPAAWDQTIDANLRSVFLCTQAAARYMIAQGNGGAVVNISSVEAAQPGLQHSHYSASKAAVETFTRASACELGAHGIRVNAVAPGLIWRENIDQVWPDGVRRWEAAAPLKRLGMPDEVADACLFLASPAARWITGATLVVDGGVLAGPSF